MSDDRREYSIDWSKKLATPLDRLTRKDIGKDDFSQFASKFYFVQKALSEMNESLKGENMLGGVFSESVEYYNMVFGTTVIDLEKYDYNNDSNLANRKMLVKQLNGLFDSIFQNKMDEQTPFFDYRLRNFISHYSFIRNFRFEEKVKSYIDGISFAKTEVDVLRNQYDGYVEEARKRATEEAVSNYAVIFDNAAKEHSNFVATWNIGKMGAAEKWLLLAGSLILGFAYFILHIKNLIPVDVESKNTTAVVIEYVTRMLVVSFAIYLITFCLKQFTIQRHLATMNRHRKNVLNSFTLFIKSIDSDDKEAKRVLMMEVAKSIYESGPSGYVAGKDSDAPSFDFSQYINPGK